MKKHKIASISSALFIIILCVSLFAACQKMEQFETNQVEKIVVWAQHTEEYELNADDSARFIELYNSSKYGGKGTGEGGTPEFGVTVYFHDGTFMRANDFSAASGDFEITLHDSDGNRKAWYYISSKELYAFVSELLDEVFESVK